MTSRIPVYRIAVVCVALAGLPVFAQQLDIKAVVLKHLKTSRDFTLKVADQMPEADYGFKLTAPQMSFAEQMVHIAQDQAFILGSAFERAAQSREARVHEQERRHRVCPEEVVR